MRTMDQYNPVALTVYFLLVSGMAMFCMDPVILVLSLAGALIFCFVQKGLNGGKMHGYAFLVFVISALINPLVSHRGATVLFVMNHNPVTLEAFLYGLTAATMIVAVLYWFHLFSLLMTSDKLLYVFGGISPKLALMLSMTLRYVPLFGKQMRKVAQAQKALGLYKEDNIIDSFRGGLRVFSVMVTWTLENGIITADSMTARGYGTGRRSRYSIFRWRKGDYIFLFLSILLFALSLHGAMLRDFVFYPVVSAAQVDLPVAIGYAAYALLVLLPTIIWGKEALKWRLLISRM